MRWPVVVMLVVCACEGNPPRPDVAEHGAPPPAAEVAPAAAAAIASPAPAPPEPVRVPLPPAPIPPGPPTPSIHGATIKLVALTDDGATALTSDNAGGIRLWPTLDASREPVVIRAAPPAALAIVRDHHDLVIADLDAAGALEIVRTSAVGKLASRAAVAADRPYALVRATPHAILAVRDDQIVDVLDLGGGRVAQLPATSGERIADIAVRRDRALAIVVAGSRVRGRWIDLGDAPAWGDSTRALALEPSRPVQLSPDHRRVLGLHAIHHVPVVIELATGREKLPYSVDIGVDPPPVREAMTTVGFVDNRTAVIDDRGTVQQWDDEAVAPVGDGPLGDFGGGEAIGDRIVVVGRGSELALVASGELVQFLGYRMPFATTVRRVGGHWFVGQPGQYSEWTELDDALEGRRVFAPPPIGGPYTTSLPLDATHGLAIAGESAKGPWQLVRFTMGNPTVEVIASTPGAWLEYEPGSHLVAVAGGKGAMFFRVDPRSATLGPPIETTLTGLIYLVDPARAHGRIGVAIDGEAGTSRPWTVTPIRALCDTCEGNVALGRPQHPNLDQGDSLMIDRHDLVHVADLTPLAHDGLVASYGSDRVTLRDATGEVRWTIALPNVSAVAWSETGELVALANGLVRIDVDTGELRERRCGWLFELAYEASFDGVPPVVCDAP